MTWQAPGRVNLIGEHTDYNAGYVLPFAIEQACAATVKRLDECTLVIRSAQRADQAHLSYDRLQPGAAVGWAAYAAGVVWAMRQRGADLPGMRIAVDSTVPPGAGLSSSAALTCAGATAVDDFLALRLSPAELLSVTRSAENDFVGAPTGGMDQLAALNCTADNALFCDMRTGGVIASWQRCWSGGGLWVRRMLTVADRVEIVQGLKAGWSIRVIAGHLDRSASVVSREVRRNSTKTYGYRLVNADCAAERRRRRPQVGKVAGDEVLRSRVLADLARSRTPWQIAGRLRLEAEDDSVGLMKASPAGGRQDGVP